MLVIIVIRDSQVPGLWSLAAQAAVLTALLHLWQSEPQRGLRALLPSWQRGCCSPPCFCRQTAHEALRFNGTA